MQQDASVRVRKFDIECRVPSETGSPQAFANRLTRIARGSLGAALESLLQPLDTASQAVVLIRKMQLDFDIESLLEESQVARLWAARFKTELLKALAQGAGEGIAVFASPAHYLASAVLEVARGQASGLWYYRRFDGLWVLPSGAAIRTALLEDTELGRQALVLLQPSSLREVCYALRAEDAQRLLQGLYATASTPAPDAVAAHGFLRRLPGSHEINAFDLPGLEQQALCLCALTTHPSAADRYGPLPELALLLARLSRLQRESPETFQALLVSSLFKGQWSAGLSGLSAAAMATLTPLISVEREVIRALCAYLDSDTEVATPSLVLSKPYPTHRFSRFGSALLLLSLIRELPLSLQGRACWEADSETAVWRWLVLCACQGGARFQAALRDPLLRELCGVPAHLIVTDALNRLKHDLDWQDCDGVFAALKRRAVEQGHGLHTLSWDSSGSKLRVTADRQSGAWLDLAVEKPNPGSEVTPVCDDEQLPVLCLRDYDWLRVNPAEQPIRAGEAFLMLLAQYVLKSLAYRLPGFANSSLRYLADNFLGMSVNLVAQESVFIAYLSRVPMSVMLNMTGKSRQRLSLPEFDARPIQLAQGD